MPRLRRRTAVDIHAIRRPSILGVKIRAAYSIRMAQRRDRVPLGQQHDDVLIQAHAIPLSSPCQIAMKRLRQAEIEFSTVFWLMAWQRDIHPLLKSHFQPHPAHFLNHHRKFLKRLYLRGAARKIRKNHDIPTVVRISKHVEWILERQNVLQSPALLSGRTTASHVHSASSPRRSIIILRYLRFTRRPCTKGTDKGYSPALTNI